MPTIDLGLLITGTNNATSGLRAAGTDLDELGAHVKKVGENSQETANRLKAIEVVIGGILIEKAVELSKAFLEMAESVQNIEIHMAAWAGGIEQGGKVLDAFRQQVGAAGIGMEVLSQAFVKLRAAGVGTDEAQKTIINLVNGIAAVGGSDLASKLEGAATAFQRFAAKGVVSTRELNAIINSTGLSVADLAAKFGRHGITIDAFWDGLKAKTISSQALLDAFNAAAEQKFGGFAALLNNTVSGSISKFKADLDGAFGSFGEAGVNNQIVAFVQNLDKAVTDFISHISKDDIARFFQYFKDAAPTLSAVGDLILFIGKAIVLISDAAFRFASLLPTDAIEFGIVGYVLMGKKGALLLGLIGALTGQLKTLSQQVIDIAGSYDKIAESGGKGYQSVLDALNKADPNSPFVNMLTAAAGATISWAHGIDDKLTPSLKKLTGDMQGLLGDAGRSGHDDFLSKMFGTPEQLKSIQDAMDKLQHTKVGETGLTSPPDPTSHGLEALQQTMENLIKSTTGKDLAMQFKTAGDTINETIQGIKDRTQQWNDQLDLAAVKVMASKLPLAEKNLLVGQMRDLQIQINKDTDDAIAQAKLLNGLKVAQLNIETQIAVGANNEAARKLALLSAQQGSWQFGMASGTAGGKLQDTVDAQKAAYAQQILGYKKQIDALDVKAATDTANAAGYKQQAASLDMLIQKTKKFSDNLTADAALQTEFFKQLGSTMENDIGNGISGLIQGTQTWGQVTQKIFGSMIDMAVKYLIQLAEIKLMTMAMGAFGFADGGVMSGGIKPFANGGIPSSQITPFANGGLTTGPTLFGLMGEAGTEAVMPLTRIGGKLGVHATGGGGNQYNITVQAIDTQTGLGFIGKHIGNIDAGLRQRQNLNRK